MKQYFSLLFVSILFVGLQGCSDSNISGSKAKNPGSPAGGPQSAKSFTESYDFDVNGCKTNKQQFASATADQTKKLLCEALQNEPLNNGCAQALRYQMFQQKCQGYSWNPNSNPLSSDIECIQYVGGNYPSTDERIRAVNACQGVRDVDAVRFVAGNYPSFSEREQAARACTGNLNVECARYVAGNYPSLSERLQATSVCHNVSIDCIKYVAGNYPSMTERMNAARSCGGN